MLLGHEASRAYVTIVMVLVEAGFAIAAAHIYM
jgi:hypothetical protein